MLILHFWLIFFLDRKESASVELCEVHPPDAEALVPDSEGLQKMEEEEEELGILQYLDQLEQVTARFFSRLVITLIKSNWSGGGGLADKEYHKKHNLT
jgi:hypothetical protein